jgi:hypothetical protein
LSAEKKGGFVENKRFIMYELHYINVSVSALIIVSECCALKRHLFGIKHALFAIKNVLTLSFQQGMVPLCTLT